MKNSVSVLQVAAIVLLTSGAIFVAKGDYICTGNILQNGGAEEGMSYWTHTGTIPFVASNVPTGFGQGNIHVTEGSKYFRTSDVSGTYGANISGAIWQDIDLSPYDVSDGNAFVSYGGDVMMAKSGPGHGDLEVKLRFYSASNTLLKEFRPDVNLDGPEPRGLWFRDTKFVDDRYEERMDFLYSGISVPSDTTKVRFICSVWDGTNSTVVHGFDDLHLELCYTPEPTSLFLLSLGGIALLRKRS